VTEIPSLLEARSLLQHGWCQGTFARDASGRPCSVYDQGAVSFDMAGAITRSSGSVEAAKPILDLIVGCLGGYGVSEWNDEAAYEEVLACINETIATVRAREALV